MATVPTKDSINAIPNRTPDFRFRNTQSQAEASLPGRQLEQQGRNLEQTAGRATALQLEVLKQANQLRVDDAINQAREQAIRLQYDETDGYENLRGYDALERPEGVPLTEEYATRYEESLSLLEQDLGNDDQRLMFREQSANLLARFRENTLRYEGQQFREYSQSVRRGTIDNRTQEIALYYNDPKLVSEALVSIEASADDLARQQGLSAAEREAFARKATSKGHMVVIETALQNENSVYADEYFKRNASRMDTDDILKVNSVLGEQLDTKIAVQTATKIIKEEQNNFITPDSDRAFNIAILTESGGKQFGGAGSTAGADQPTTSPAGAIGIAQIMPATAPEAAKLAGLEWDEERYKNDAEYNRALGKAYFDKQLKDFDGSLAKAYAAYNAGPGATRKAIKEAGEGGDWLSLLPKETQNYVDKNITAYQNGKGQNQRPSLAQVLDKVRNEVGTDSPRRLKLALDQAEKQYDVITESIKAEEDRAVSNAMQALIDNGGDYGGLPPLVRSSIPPQEVGKVMDFAKKISKGDDTTNLVLYNQFTENPEMLTVLSDDKFNKLQMEFSESDFKHFSKIRADLLKGNVPEAQNPGSLNTAAIKSSVDIRLAQLGINAKDDPERVGSIRKFVNQAIASAQNANGKKFNDVEVDSFVDKLFTQQGTYDGYVWDTQGPILATKPSQIPNEIKTQLKTAFEKQGFAPSDQDLLEAYWRQIFATRSKQNDKGSL